jgi:hypothetical protein
MLDHTTHREYLRYVTVTASFLLLHPISWVQTSPIQNSVPFFSWKPQVVLVLNYLNTTPRRRMGKQRHNILALGAR